MCSESADATQLGLRGVAQMLGSIRLSFAYFHRLAVLGGDAAPFHYNARGAVIKGALRLSGLVKPKQTQGRIAGRNICIRQRDTKRV